MTVDGIRNALVVAHPDDEALWFSSVLADVERLVICFSEIRSFPGWTRGRREAFGRYPFTGLTVLGLCESEVFNGADWHSPELAPYGMVVGRHGETLPGFNATRYRENFEILCARLRTVLVGCERVYTHNPWGEYGHEEHVQVYAAVKVVQAELGFEMVWSNYVSNKSWRLMLARAQCAGITMQPTRPDIADTLQRLYSTAGCWTWYEDYVWPAMEGMVTEGAAAGVPGQVLPLNLVTVDYQRPVGATSWNEWLRRTGSAARRLASADRQRS